tara:strand:+ start:1463 stop:1891 length:429 start_codon:yes stop_codon:yes gene_type:complete
MNKKVMTGGAFDLLHWGHLLLFEECTKYGDYLIVSVLSDARIRAKKGKNRPIIPEAGRIAMVEALSVVDEVVCLSGDPDYPVIKLLDIHKPDVLVLNQDEFADFSEEKNACRERNIELVFVPRLIPPTGLDTTKIVAKIRGN